MDLSVSLAPQLVGRDPFIIASSHWTATEACFHQLAPFEPAAVTLKTTSDRKGGDGRESPGRTRERHDIRDHFGHVIAKFTDGAKPFELWDISTTFTQTQAAKVSLPKSRIGLSILAGEDYSAVAGALNLRNYDYVELNWKYAFRAQNESRIENIHADVSSFFVHFGTLPVMIKLSRESLPLLFSGHLDPVMELVAERSAGFVIANSKRINVPPSRVVGTPKELSRGVVIGEYLFLETFDTIRRFKQLKRFRGIPVLASGGIVDIAGVVDLLAIGVNGIQLCTAMDLHGLNVLSLLREQLSRIASVHSNDFQSFLEFLRASEDNWFAAAKTAREVEYDAIRSVRTSLKSHSGRVANIVADALLNECGTKPDKQVAKLAAQPASAAQLQFLLNRGNVSAFLLSRKCAEKLSAATVEIKGFGELIHRLKQANGFYYDFVILPQSSIEFLQKDDSTVNEHNKPVIVGEVGHSVWELVGDTRTQVKDITLVYHFSGTSSRAAVARMLPNVKPAKTEIMSPKLLPLFKFWHSDHALLAKPPLSRIYGLLCEKGLSSRWGPLWQHSEPLHLVTSRQHQDKYGQSYVAKVLDEVRNVKTILAREPLTCADDLLADGFFSLFESQILAGRNRDSAAQ